MRSELKVNMLKKTDKYVKLSIFNKWRVSNIIGFKTVETEGTKFVNFVWCKICAKHENCVVNRNVCGATKDSAKTFGTWYKCCYKIQYKYVFFYSSF